MVDIVTEAFPEVDEVIDKASGPQGPPGGPWASAKTYPTGSLVTRAKAGVWYAWVSVQATTGDDPATDDGTNWVQGDQIDLVAAQFDISEAVDDPSVEGLFSWNSDDKAPQYGVGISGVSNQLGQEIWTPRVKNTTAAQIDNGRAVYISGATGANPTIAPANADDPSTRKVLALATHDISINGFGYCTAFGMVRDIDTTGTDESEVWAAGDELFLSDTADGRLTKVAPTSPSCAIRVGYVVISHANNGSIFVTIGVETDQFVRALAGAAVELVLTDVRETRYNEGGVSGSQEIDAGNGNRQEFTMTGNVTGQSFAGFTSGVAQTVEVWWISNGNTMAWDASIDWGTQGAPTTPPDGEKLRTWFETVDGGTIVYGRHADGYTE